MNVHVVIAHTVSAPISVRGACLLESRRGHLFEVKGMLISLLKFRHQNSLVSTGSIFTLQ